jgi:cellulose synthase/poly-beta-1,6-N-acetylglucosamine synthase-like glycosyltransferase
LAKVLVAYSNQTYTAIEIIICDDGSIDGTDKFIEKVRANYRFPIKYVNTYDTANYGLAKARNMGVIEAEGKCLLFNDVRLVPEPDMVHQFVYNKNLKEKMWLFGNKGTGKKTFIENLSFINRQEFINAGMCCERIDRYGGMSQELRNRFGKQGFTFKLIEEAKATQQIKGSGRKNKNDIITMKDTLYKMGLE